MTATVLVTGAGGYLGGRVASALQEAGYSIRLMSRNEALLSDLAIEGELIVARSLDDEQALASACHGADAVVHLAAPHEVEAQRHPLAAIDATVLGTWRLVEAAASEHVRRFVYFSTAHVYGSPLLGRLDETLATRPTHPYSIGHRAAEDVVLAARHRFDAALVLRLSNVVGAPARRNVDRWTLVANDLCRQAVAEGRLVLKTPGLQPRDFLPMSDLLAAVVHVLRVEPLRLQDGLFNVGAGQSLTVLALAERVAERTERRLGARPPVERPLPPPDSRAGELTLCIDRLLATGFAPRGSLDSALDELLAYCAREVGARPEE